MTPASHAWSMPRMDPLRDSVPAPPEDDKRRLKKSTDKLATLADNPGAGRTTRLGRRTESPASIKTAGPSGQRGRAQHQKLHPNK